MIGSLLFSLFLFFFFSWGITVLSGFIMHVLAMYRIWDNLKQLYHSI